MKTTGLTLEKAWKERTKLRSEGAKLWIKGDKVRAEGEKLQAKADDHRAKGYELWANGSKLRAKGEKLWKEAINEIKGNIKFEWLHYSPKKDDYECHLETGEVFKP